jgi:hypothetical protein
MLTALNYLILCKQIISGVRELVTHTDLIPYKAVLSVELTRSRVIYYQLAPRFIAPKYVFYTIQLLDKLDWLF